MTKSLSELSPISYMNPHWGNIAGCVAHLAAVAATRVRIPYPANYCT